MSVFRKINGSMIPVTTEGHQQYYFDTLAQAEEALSQLEDGADVFIKEGSNEDLLPRVEQAEENIVQLNSNLSDIIRIETIYKEGVTLTANDGTTVDFTSEIASATPSGYKFIGMLFCGAYPNSTWNNVSVTPGTVHPINKSMRFTTTWTQPYKLCMAGIFIRNI